MWIDSCLRIGSGGGVLSACLNWNLHTKAFTAYWRRKPILSIAYRPLSPHALNLGPLGFHLHRVNLHQS